MASTDKEKNSLKTEMADMDYTSNEADRTSSMSNPQKKTICSDLQQCLPTPDLPNCSAVTSESGTIPHTPSSITIGDGSNTPHHEQTYGNFSVVAQPPLGDTIEDTITLAEFTILK
ncbi:unnamed protein product [Psylliodes chrysocephalus]|uniref:Uncharacterized protein n=1 Tax=Psylliodes chrysocephalus TaxID=3402493 RepID=A0A9P0GGI7_9CUCU|nr:unnamed protein product [Psylliodes chrysocephala]